MQAEASASSTAYDSEMIVDEKGVYRHGCYPVEDAVVTAGQSSRQAYASPTQQCIPNQILTLEFDAPAHI